MSKKSYYIIVYFTTIILFARSNSPLFAQSKDTLTYIFLGHIYQYGSGGDRVDYRIEKMDLSRFDRIWLGGDVCSEASLEYSTLAYINKLFDLGKPGNHWALGNHDTRNGNLEWIREFTGRPTYYAYNENGITTIVINGTITPLDCENLNKQFKMIENVCDTISTGYLIFLVHHGIYTDVPGIPNPPVYGQSHLKSWIANCYDDSAAYIDAIYPMLINVENKGVEVLHIMGDVGDNYFYGISDDGIEYFGSGINNSSNMNLGIPITSPDYVLVFKHVVSTNELTWEFVELNSL